MRGYVNAGIGAAVIAVGLWSGGANGEASGKWSERVQIVYDAGTKSVERVRLRVWDAEPERNLEFLWEPDQNSGFDHRAADGMVEGRGKLVWRVRGSAPHDPRTIYSVYVGEMRDGRPHGDGKLELRAGEIFEGQWVAGRLHGEGVHLDAAGNRYAGTFENGVPHGRGRLALANGSIYEGEFRNGLRDGEGRMRLPGGTDYASRWKEGVEIGGPRHDILADATVGGLLRAQTGGGDAGKVDLSVIVEPRMTQQAEMKYLHTVQDEHIEIYPDDEDIIGVWTGEASSYHYSYLHRFRHIDWDNAPVFLQVTFETTDRSRVKLDGLELQVEDSQVYRKPFLTVVGHYGCIGYRPGFSFQNNGWGPVQDAALSLEFYSEDNPQLASRRFSAGVGSFDLGGDVAMEPVLQQAGVDTAALAQARFTCPSEDEVPQCRQQAVDSLSLGEIAPLVGGMNDLSVGVRGTIDYRWADDRGNVYDQSEPFDLSIQLGYFETERMVAEGGGYWGSAPAALRYQEVHLPADRQNYVIDMPVRGNKNLAAYVARLKMFAEHSSYHRFRAVARFEDGSERYSKPVSLYYVKPQLRDYEPPQPAQACYLDPAFFEGD